ncbi:hypothetical protein [Absidia glauca]|uniref:Uncharacterized protein n=1 Tax=Absidia glauca TaxID=4829 RepID=A0A168LWT8_ABSGL|nr:hypothetical protein [Absidia glauca]
MPSSHTMIKIPREQHRSRCLLRRLYRDLITMSPAANHESTLYLCPKERPIWEAGLSRHLHPSIHPPRLCPLSPLSAAVPPTSQSPDSLLSPPSTSVGPPIGTSRFMPSPSMNSPSQNTPANNLASINTK